MEKTLTNFNELTKVGQVILADTLMKDEVMVYTGKHESHKYPITSNGRKCRSLGYINGSIQYAFADTEGATGDEMIYCYDFLGEMGSNATFKETDSPSSFNIRLIDESHPKYNPEIANYGVQFNSMLNTMLNMFK